MDSRSKVLLMTDFSEVAGYAAYYTKKIAAKLQAKVEIMHILSTPVDWVHLDKDKERFYPQTLQEIANAKNNLSQLVKDFEKEGIQTTSNLIYSFGSLTVFEHIIHSNPELVIMGSEGRGAKRNFYMGSNAQKILRNVKIPTLIVKDAPGKAEINKIAFLSTLDDNQKPVFERLKKLAKTLDAKLDVVFVNTPYNFYQSDKTEELFRDFIGESSDCGQHLINAEDLENGIMYYSERNQPDIFAVAKTDKSGLAKFFNPSLTENLVRIHDFPILSIYIE